ncbi:MAG: hypothetical protein PHX43_01070 [Alphaproteobacteria bacterium]|nr:hypothetical protein [Alphaproteobacteria bacterium]
MSTSQETISEFAPIEVERSEPAQSTYSTDTIFWPHLNTLSSELAALHVEEPLNENEWKSIRALIAYVAYDKHVNEDVVCSFVERRFAVKNIIEICSQDYEDVIRYLIDLEPKDFMH